MYYIPNSDLVIYCAAIQFHNGQQWVEIYGKRHHLIVEEIRAAGLLSYYKKWHEDGFLIGHLHYTRGSTKGWPHFYTRAEATILMQMFHVPMRGHELNTKDLW